jgi:hypothetical protein
MTDPSEVVVSDEQAIEFMREYKRLVLELNPGPLPPYSRPNPNGPERRAIEYTRQALSAFLAERVPDAKTGSDSRCCNLIAEDTWNELRDRVLKGE